MKESKNIDNIYQRLLNIELMERENILDGIMELKNGSKSANHEEKNIQLPQSLYTQERMHFLFYLTKLVL